LLLVPFLTLIACQQQEATATSKPAESSLERIIQRKAMRVGYVRFAPCAEMNPQTGELEGIFVDAIREVATDLKVQVEFKETTLSTFTAALKAGEFDFSIGPTFITPTRALSVKFTEPLLALGNSGIVKRENATRFSTLDALSKPGVRIAVLQGQAMEQLVRSRFSSARLIVIAGSDLTAPLLAVEAGQADIGLSNSVTVQNFSAAHREMTPVLTAENALARLALAWVVRTEDTDLKDFLNSSIEWLNQSGKLQQIQSRYPIRLSALR